MSIETDTLFKLGTECQERIGSLKFKFGLGLYKSLQSKMSRLFLNICIVKHKYTLSLNKER